MHNQGYTQHHVLSTPSSFVFSPDSFPRELSCLSEENPRKAPTSHSKEPLVLPVEYAIVSRNVCCEGRPVIDNPFRSEPSRGQVDFCFLGLLARHSDFPGYERDVTRIALRTLDLQIHALNSLPSGPRA